MLDFHGLAKQPDAVDWLFPADRYAAAGSRAPVVSAQQLAVDLGRRTCGHDEVHPLRLNLVRFLGAAGMMVDHHGWVSLDTRPQRPGVSFVVWAERPSWFDLAAARVLRSLAISGLTGWSRSGYEDPNGFSYALGFLERLRQDVPAVRRNPTEALALWEAAARMP